MYKIPKNYWLYNIIDIFKYNMKKLTYIINNKISLKNLYIF